MRRSGADKKRLHATGSIWLAMLTTWRFAMSASMSLSRIGQIAVNAHDVERATAFYRDTLGMKYLFSAPKLAFFDCDGVRLMLSPPEEKEFDHPSSVLYF